MFIFLLIQRQIEKERKISREINKETEREID